MYFLFALESATWLITKMPSDAFAMHVSFVFSQSGLLFCFIRATLEVAFDPRHTYAMNIHGVAFNA
jgi:hypothetical protein